MSSNVKNLFAKLNWLRSYWAVNFVYSAIFSTIFRNLVIFRMSYLRNQMRFSKTFFTFQFFYEYSFKICFNLSWHKLKVIFSLRTKRLEVVASRKNGRARRRHACLPRAPAKQAKSFSVLLSVLWRHFRVKNCQYQKSKNMRLLGI